MMHASAVHFSICSPLQCSSDINCYPMNSQQRNIKYKKSPEKPSHQNKHPQKMSKKSRPKQKTLGHTLFDSNRLHRLPNNRESYLSEKEILQGSNKAVTTDESNGYESQLHQSIFYCENKNHKYSNEGSQYFQNLHHLDFRNKRKKLPGRAREQHTSKLKNMESTLLEMKSLVRSQQKEIGSLKDSLNNKELGRLVKMQSIQKLMLLEGLKEATQKRRSRV